MKDSEQQSGPKITRTCECKYFRGKYNLGITWNHHFGTRKGCRLCQRSIAAKGGCPCCRQTSRWTPSWLQVRFGVFLPSFTREQNTCMPLCPMRSPIWTLCSIVNHPTDCCNFSALIHSQTSSPPKHEQSRWEERINQQLTKPLLLLSLPGSLAVCK